MRRALILSLLLVGACASRTTKVVWHVEPPREQHGDGNVELLDAAPAEPFQLLAVVEVTDESDRSDLDQMRAALRKKAAEIGADAVVVAAETPRSSVAVSPWNVEHLYRHVLTGRAIVYTANRSPVSR